MIVGCDGVVLQRVLKQLGERNRREQQAARVGGLNLHDEPHAAGVADFSQSPVPFERLELVGERDQRPAAAVEDVPVGRAQRPDEPGGRVAPLIDEVRERVEVVEEEVRIDLASEAFELGLQACLLRPRAPHARAFPVAEQEHGFVDVGDGDDERDDGKESRRQSVLTCPGVAGGLAPDPEKRYGNRNRVQAIKPSSSPSRLHGRSSQSSGRGSRKYRRRLPSQMRNATSANQV